MTKQNAGRHLLPPLSIKSYIGLLSPSVKTLLLGNSRGRIYSIVLDCKNISIDSLMNLLIWVYLLGNILTNIYKLIWNTSFYYHFLVYPLLDPVDKLVVKISLQESQKLIITIRTLADLLEDLDHMLLIHMDIVEQRDKYNLFKLILKWRNNPSS